MKGHRIRISHYRFPNVDQLLNGDIANKINKNWSSRKFMESKCNFRDKNCPHAGNCGKTCVVHKAECMKTGKMYIGQTQNTLKNA